MIISCITPSEGIAKMSRNSLKIKVFQTGFLNGNFFAGVAAIWSVLFSYIRAGACTAGNSVIINTIL
jgi:hypothetical protein